MPHKTTLFLASSKELKAERDDIEKFIGQRNKLWQPQGIFLHLEIWEDFDDAMSATRKQDDYDAAIRAADAFVVLVHTRVGKYTREEFEIAWQQFQATGRPKILVYFKSPVPAGEPEPGPEYAGVRELQRRMAELGHFPNSFDQPSELLLHLGAQLDKWRASGFIRSVQAGASAPASYRATVSGPGASAQGNGATAVAAGAVYVGGNNTGPINTGRQSTVHYGGTHVGGNVSVVGGDFVGGNKVVHGLGGTDVAATLEALRSVLAQHAPSPEAARLAAGNLDALKAEAAKPAAERNDGVMAHLLKGLADLVPDAIGAVAGAFASPVLARLAGPATQAVLRLLGR